MSIELFSRNTLRYSGFRFVFKSRQFIVRYYVVQRWIGFAYRIEYHSNVLFRLFCSQRLFVRSVLRRNECRFQSERCHWIDRSAHCVGYRNGDRRFGDFAVDIVYLAYKVAARYFSAGFEKLVHPQSCDMDFSSVGDTDRYVCRYVFGVDATVSAVRCQFVDHTLHAVIHACAATYHV